MMPLPKDFYLEGKHGQRIWLGSEKIELGPVPQAFVGISDDGAPYLNSDDCQAFGEALLKMAAYLREKEIAALDKELARKKGLRDEATSKGNYASPVHGMGREE
jgi:hypothetical protein